MLRPLALLAVLVLLVAACAGDDAGDSADDATDGGTEPTEVTEAPTAAPSPTAVTPTTPSPQPTPTEVALDASCVLEPTDGGDVPAVELSHPAGWDVGADEGTPCRFFDPEPTGLPDESETLAVDVQWSVDPVPFARAAEPAPTLEEASRLPTTVDGNQAVRLVGTSTGDGLVPAGVERTLWLVDLAGAGDGAQATLVGATTDVDGVDYEQAAAVLDRMARSVDVAPGDDVAVPLTTVARAAGGGAPYTVVYDGTRTCLDLYAGDVQGPRVAEACDLAGPGPLTAAVLDEEDLRIAAGLAGDEVDVVRLRANTDADRAVATVPVGDGLRGWALPLSGTEARLVAETFDGEELGDVEVLG